MPHHRNHALAGFAAVVLSILASTALAADDKMFAPQICVAVEGSDNHTAEAEVRVDAVEQTQGEGYQIFVCPLVRDLVVGELGKLWVWVGNANPKDDTPPECCVHSLSPSSNFYDYACEIAGEAVGRHTLEFQLDDFEEAPDGFFVVTCDLGFGDTIHGIRTREQ